MTKQIRIKDLKVGDRYFEEWDGSFHLFEVTGIRKETMYKIDSISNSADCSSSCWFPSSRLSDEIQLLLPFEGMT